MPTIANTNGVTAAARSQRSALLGVIINPFLVVVKLTAGIYGHSYALIADAIESGLDIGVSVVTWRALRLGAKPPDSDHPYGHGKVEPLTAMVIALTMIAAAIGLALESVRLIVTPHEIPHVFTLPILAVVIVTKVLLSRFVFKVGQTVNSTIVRTDAWHHSADALVSIFAFIGISVAIIKGKGYESADDWAALIACGIIIFNALHMFRPALAEVMDAAPDNDDIEKQVRQIASSVKDVRLLEKCRVRKYGLKWIVDLHVGVDGDLSVKRGHAIAHEVKDALIQADIGVADVLVHIEPVDAPGAG
jgi:cation diffusion facilitator family transporter